MPLFPKEIRDKFPVQTQRHIANAINAGWMLRNIPVEPLSPEEREFLKVMFTARLKATDQLFGKG